MKNLIYFLAIAVMGLVACGAPADKKATETSEEVVETVVETTDSMEVVAEETEVDSMATEETAE